MSVAWTPTEILALIERARQQCVEIAAARKELAITRQETRALIERSQQIHNAAVWFAATPPSEAPAPAAAYNPLEEPNAHALETLRTIRDLLNGYPIEWQVTLVRILAVRTAAVAYDRMHPQLSMSA
jgi:hypothetical protein